MLPKFARLPTSRYSTSLYEEQFRFVLQPRYFCEGYDEILPAVYLSVLYHQGVLIAMGHEKDHQAIIIKCIQDMYSTTVHKCNTRTKFLNLTCN